MNTKINRASLIMPDESKNVIWPQITVSDVESYRCELIRLTGAVRVLLDHEEIGQEEVLKHDGSTL